MMRRITYFAMLVTCAVLLAGCASHSAAPPTAETHGLSGDLAKQYGDIASLARDSAAVVIATPTDQAVQEPADAAGKSGVFTTVTTVNVVKVLKGSTPAATLRIRQLLVEDAKALTPGSTYVLFITPFHFATGPSNGEWVITGAVGSYSVAGTTLSLAPGASGGLPQQLDMTDLVRQLG